MNEQPPQFPSPYPQPQFQPPPPAVTPRKPQNPFTRIPVLIVLIIIALAVLGAVVWFTHEQSRTTVSNNSSQTPSLTLYYSDGKTVLWHSGTSTTNNAAPAFVVYIQAQLRARYGNNYLTKGNWAVTTTLNNSLQATAIKQVQTQQIALKQQKVNDAAFVAENITNGQMVSWVGNIDNQGTQDNTQTLTTVGSLQLPFTYATYLTDTPNTLDTTLDDAQMPLPGWPCTD
ncbi:MAG TPA: hypothetical protein VMB52_04705, partial [Verrucomicrobiae bacterium]|nr:hypothetical protein [Verrucomicrobiae bacterium]